jgi:hypothetical protein
MGAHKVSQENVVGHFRKQNTPHTWAFCFLKYPMGFYAL